MSQDDLFGAPAGWYPDPLGLPQLRWWNNHAWTEQTSAARQPMVVQDTKFAWADDDLPSRRQERERERAQDSGDRTPTVETPAAAETLRELEPPRAFTKIEQQPPAEAVAEGVTFEAPSAPSTDAPQTDKWWSAPKAAESRRAAAAARQAAAAQAAAAQAAARATVPTAAPAAAQAAAPVADNPFAYTAAPASTSFGALFDAAPVAPSASEPAATADANPFAYTAGSSFSSLFDTTPSAPANAEALDSLFGEETRTPRGAQVRTPVITAEEALRSNPALAGDKLVTTTGASWVIAVLPLLQLVVSLLLVTSLGGTLNLAPIFIAILVVPYLATVALAYIDYRTLLRTGTKRPAHWAFAFLTAPVYLVLRARATLRETGHGIGPVLVWFAMGILQVVSVLAIPGILIAAVPTVYAQQIEQSVEYQAATIAGSEMTVDCTGMPPVVAGQEIECAATNAAGGKTNVTVTLARQNGWISWQVVDWGTYSLSKS